MSGTPDSQALLDAWREFLKKKLIREWPQENAEIVFLAFVAAWDGGRAAERERWLSFAHEHADDDEPCCLRGAADWIGDDQLG